MHTVYSIVWGRGAVLGVLLELTKDLCGKGIVLFAASLPVATCHLHMGAPGAVPILTHTCMYM